MWRGLDYPDTHLRGLRRAPNGPELSRPDALGSPSPTLQQLQCAFESPFSAAVRVGSSELFGGGHPSGQGDPVGRIATGGLVQLLNKPLHCRGRPAAWDRFKGCSCGDGLLLRWQGCRFGATGEGVNEAIPVVHKPSEILPCGSAKVGRARDKTLGRKQLCDLLPPIPNPPAIPRGKETCKAGEVAFKDAIPHPFVEIALSETHGKEDFSSPGCCR